MALGRLIERLFVQVRADLSQLSGELAQGVGQTRTATQQMAKQWETVSSSIENLTTDLQRGLITQGQYMAQLNRHASAVSKLGGSYREAQRQVHGYAASLRQAAVAAPVAFNSRPIQGFTRSAGQARMQMMNLGYQLNDVGMTLATGMNPLTVLIQQGSQILQIYAGQGGVRTALGDISKMLVGIGKHLWPIAVLAAGFGILTREINKTTDVSVTFGDTLLAVFQVLGRKIMDGPIGKALIWLGDTFNWLLDEVVVPVAKAIGNTLIKTFRIAKAGIKAAMDDLPGIFKGAFYTAVAKALEALYQLGAEFEGFMGGISATMNEVFGTSFDENPVYDWVSSLEFARYQAQKTADESGEAFNQLGEKIAEIMASDPMGGLFDEVRTQAIENAMARVAAGVEDVGGAAGRAAEEIEDLMEKLEEGLTTAADNLAGVFGNAFERLAETGRFTFRDFIQDMNRLIIKSTSELLQQELSNLFKQLATSRGGLGSLFSNIFTGLFGGGNMFGARARGGVEMPWKSFVAGEEGPELVTQDGPSGARRVKTAGQTAAAMRQGGGAPVIVNQYIQTPDVESFRQSQGQLAARASMFLARGRRNQ